MPLKTSVSSSANEKKARKVVNNITGKECFLAKIDKRLKKRTPAAPFITSTLQQEAARRLRFPAKKTMMIAQQLYEGVELGPEGSVGLITYMRTDSFRTAPEAQQWARDFIDRNSARTMCLRNRLFTRASNRHRRRTRQ